MPAQLVSGGGSVPGLWRALICCLTVCLHGRDAVKLSCISSSKGTGAV